MILGVMIVIESFTLSELSWKPQKLSLFTVVHKIFGKQILWMGHGFELQWIPAGIPEKHCPLHKPTNEQSMGLLWNQMVKQQ